MPKNSVSYKVGTQEIELKLKPTTQYLIIEASLNKTGIKYKGCCTPYGRTPSNLAESIFKKSPNVKIGFKGNQLLLSVGNNIAHLPMHISPRGKENESYKLYNPSIASTPSSPYTSELIEIQKDVRECKLGYQALKEDLKELKDTMHRTLDQQTTNYTDRSLYTRCNIEDSIAVHRDQIITQYIEKSKLQEALNERNKEIESLKQQIRSMSSEQKLSKNKLDKEICQFKVGLKQSINQIMQVLTKSTPHSKKIVKPPIPKEKARVAYKSRYNGCIKKPRMVPLANNI